MTAEPQYHTQCHITHLLLEEGWPTDQTIELYVTFEGRRVRMANIYSTEQACWTSKAFRKVEMVRMPLIWHDVTTHNFQTLIKCLPLLIMHCTVQQNLVDKES